MRLLNLILRDFRNNSRHKKIILALRAAEVRPVHIAKALKVNRSHVSNIIAGRNRNRRVEIAINRATKHRFFKV